MMEVPKDIRDRLVYAAKPQRGRALDIIANSDSLGFGESVARLKGLGDAGLDELVSSMSYGSCQVCLFSARALGTYGKNAKAKEALKNALCSDVPTIGAMACHCLQGKLSKNDIPWLVEKINFSDSEYAPARFIRALTYINCAESSKELLKIVKNNPSHSGRFTVLESLSSRGYAPAIGALIDTFSEYIDAANDNPEKNMLQRMILDFAPDDLAREANRSLFSGRDKVEAASMEVLAFCGIERALPILSRLLSEAEGKTDLPASDRHIAMLAVITLGDFKSVDALPAIMGAIKIMDPLVRSQVFRAISKIGSLSAVPFLIEQLQSEVDQVSLGALHSLEALKADFAYPHILPMLLSDSPGKRHEAAVCIARFGKSYDAIAWLTMQARKNVCARIVATEMLIELRKNAAKAGEAASPVPFDLPGLKRFPPRARAGAQPQQAVAKAKQVQFA